MNDEAVRLGTRARVMERAADGLKSYLKSQLERAGETKVAGKLCTVRIQANPLAVATIRLTDEEIQTHRDDAAWMPFLVPVPAKVIVDNRAILRAYKAGEPVPSEVVIERGTHLRIA